LSHRHLFRCDGLALRVGREQLCFFNLSTKLILLSGQYRRVHLKLFTLLQVPQNNPEKRQRSGSAREEISPCIQGKLTRRFMFPKKQSEEHKYPK